MLTLHVAPDHVRLTYAQSLITAPDLERVLRMEAQALQAAPPLPLVIDVSAPVWALSVESAMKTLMASYAPFIAQPVALLTAPGCDDLIRRVAWEFAQHGMLRRCFHDEGAARAWLSTRSRVRTAPLSPQAGRVQAG